MKYPINIEKAENNYSAYCPDVPGCVAVGETLESVKQRYATRIRQRSWRRTSVRAEALEFHFEGLLMDKDPIPEPKSIVDSVEVNIPTVAPQV